ncbi:DUF2213 domain-containing protein [Pectobacterium brasiliense]|uniref:DUF2213 domain-containing protein n=1 Tax=Pectobacterium brasiliense TaxID=180957 RepID=A0AAW9HGI3_9GAMM|nr:DUF2213 domain-containing protein [Pectobacterium brasiliense]MDY4380352.1 DUF2213 domain-containing protein [Pectobacterium brasiliense]
MTQRVYDINGWPEIPDNPISMAGVFEYLGKRIPGAPDPDKIYYVWRPEEELEDPDCIESFKLLPWTDDHPPGLLGDDDEGLTPPEEKGIQGVIGERVYYKDGVLRGNIKLFSKAMKMLIEAGKKELSPGYRSKYEWKTGVATGVADGQPYDVIQRKIRGNHLSLVDEGRQGPAVAVLDAVTLDAKDIQMADDNENKAATTTDNDETQNSQVSLEEGIKIFMTMLPVLQKLVSATAAAPAEETPPATTTDEDTPPENQPAQTTDEDDPNAAATQDDDDEDKETAAALDSMDKRLTGLEKNSVKAVLREIRQRDDLAEKLSWHVGTFDAAEMTTADVAAYGVKKLGISAPKGQEMTFLKGYLDGASAAATNSGRHTVTLDSADENSVVMKYVKGAK